MTPHLSKLHRYPFEKLRQLLEGLQVKSNQDPIPLTLGEPQHPLPPAIGEAILENLAEFARYPSTPGIPELRLAIANWLVSRFGLKPGSIDPERQILPAAGTREALFAFAQLVVDPADNPLVLMPNPFYQIYEGAALLAGAEAFYLNTVEQNRFLPDFDQVSESIWRRCQLIYICNPGNPTGSVIPLEQLQRLIELALRHDFVIASDECYSEIYLDEANPPPGLLQAAQAMQLDDFSRCVVFHSLSKRSNAPGLRSGFVAGDAKIIAQFARYRSYHGSTLPLPIQRASIAAWSDETHVHENRRLYREKFSAVQEILKADLALEIPEAGFFLWPKTPIADTDFTRDLFVTQHVSVLPGRYLSRPAEGIDPGEHRVRIALVAAPEVCVEAAQRIKHYLTTL